MHQILCTLTIGLLPSLTPGHCPSAAPCLQQHRQPLPPCLHLLCLLASMLWAKVLLLAPVCTIVSGGLPRCCPMQPFLSNGMGNHRCHVVCVTVVTAHFWRS